MITGDNALTACSVARDIGIHTNHVLILTKRLNGKRLMMVYKMLKRFHGNSKMFQH